MTKAFIILSAIFLLLILPNTSAEGFRKLAANTAVNAANTQTSTIVGNNNAVSQSATNNVVAASVANGTLSPSCLIANPANPNGATGINAVNNQISGIVGNGNSVDQSAVNNIVASALAAGTIMVNPTCVTPPSTATTGVNAQNNQVSAIVGGGNTVSQSAANNVVASSNGGGS